MGTARVGGAVKTRRPARADFSRARRYWIVRSSSANSASLNTLDRV